MNITIWHNEKCSKSRQALEYLENKNLNIEIKNYLENTPSKEEIKEILELLNIKAYDLIRTSETLFTSLNLNENMDENTLIDFMSLNPSLIQRPIIIKENKAVISRPFSLLEELV
ncbi:MAG: arsenate reductase (glutaredoxin) [Campylobacterales bacterium]|nr:arsenate reductase (glutaredoxin) [Campylobacterales bacterium]NQY53598.1 arsenate reductase (glutaredoxin) [Campylobacteraceae bacterium]